MSNTKTTDITMTQPQHSMRIDQQLRQNSAVTESSQQLPPNARETDTSRLHVGVSACASTAFNIYETTDLTTSSTILASAGEPKYGMLTVDSNAGLRQPQARSSHAESYNSGCTNPHGCVSNPKEGFLCPGSVRTQSPTMRKLYDELNRPYAANFDMLDPPEYVVGIKENSINSVSGWNDGGNRAPILGNVPRWKASQDATTQACSHHDRLFA